MSSSILRTTRPTELPEGASRARGLAGRRRELAAFFGGASHPNTFATRNRIFGGRAQADTHP